ncbi:hypothetical protein [Aquabacterium sp.]|uniref:hypothetical protein n=1 Tax=Aquabacterium sp. TaxID=1872578 RepID=UPI002CA58A6A|nr:hypothetical protein [Aquabacterium sp.]HSW07597.1 hypothetical protein [Aquabacterium sp.]
MPAALVAYTVAAYTSSQSQVLTIHPTGITLTPNGNNIAQASPGSYDLVVSGRLPVNIQFSVTDSSGATCAVVGIAIDPVSGGGTVRDAFPTALINANGLTLADNDPTNSSYDFLLLIQNAEGDLGLIDPLITNQ